MKYNPEIHKRHSIRLHNYDYADMGVYFVTVCLDKRIPKSIIPNRATNISTRATTRVAPTDLDIDFPTFGHIENGIMILNEYGNIAHNELEKLSERFKNVSFDVFQIMPDHVHVIIEIQKKQSAKIGQIVGAYKSLVVKKCLDFHNSCRGDPCGRPGCDYGRPKYDLYKFWQRNYHEHIIRNEIEYFKITEYIYNNPVLWK